MTNYSTTEEETAPLINSDDEHVDLANVERHASASANTTNVHPNNGFPRRSIVSKVGSYVVVLVSSVALYLKPLHFAIVGVTFLPTIACIAVFAAVDNTPTDSSQQAVNLKTLLVTALFTGMIGIAVVSIVSAVLCYILALPLLGSYTMEYMTEASRVEDTLGALTGIEVQRRAWLASRWQYWVYMLLFTFVGAGFLEELLKYICLMISKTYFVPYFSSSSPSSTVRREIDSSTPTPTLTETSYIFIMVAVALGYSSIESLGFLFVALHKAHESGSKLLLSLAERTLLGAPLHTMFSVLVAVNTVRHDRQEPGYQHLWQILLVPVLVHGAFDFALLGTSAWLGNVGWVHPETGSRAAWFLLVVVLVTVFGYGGYVWAEVMRLGLS